MRVQHAAQVFMLLALLAPLCTWLAPMGNAADRYTTRRGDTLWKIAERYVHGDTMTTYQMMVALFDANPEAFMNNDINLLKIGYALHIPTPEALGVPPLTPPDIEDERGAAAIMEPSVSTTEKDDAASAIVAEEMAKLQHHLALTQERATRQHVENEALRSRVEALEARVIKLDEVASVQDAAGRDDKAMTPWWTLPNVVLLISGIVVLGLALSWFWRWRTMANTAASGSPQIDAEQLDTEATAPLALGLGDLDVDTDLPGAAQDATAARPDASLEMEAAADATRAHLMIDLDDLELEPAQARGATPGLSSTASISPKADPSSPSNTC
jgi:FimV-like protein